MSTRRRKRRKRNYLPYIIMFPAVVIVCVAAIVIIQNTLINNRILAEVIIEAGDELPDAGVFCKDDSLQASFNGDIAISDTSVPGKYPLEVTVDGKTYKVSLIVEDTVSPSGTVKSCEIWMGEEIGADLFVTSVTDVSEVAATFAVRPDFDLPGTQDIHIVLEDSSGNKTDLNTSLTIKEDKEPPVISGTSDKTVFIGENVSYRKNVTVTDNKDVDVQIEIDNSSVDPAKAGRYPVKYSAADSAGNRTEITVYYTFQIKPEGYVSEDELYELVDQVLDEIIDPGMSDLEKMSEIFYWIADHINYIGTSDKSDWIKGAYLGMTRGTGDCFNYFAAAKAFLTRAGYETIPIERVKDAKTRHYWNLVKYEGEWYHFDPLPNLAKYHYVCLLRTDAEVAEYSKKNTRFYEFDKTGIPATATKPLDIERKVING